MKGEDKVKWAQNCDNKVVFVRESDEWKWIPIQRYDVVRKVTSPTRLVTEHDLAPRTGRKIRF